MNKQTRIEISDKAQGAADFTGEVHVVLTYTDGLVVTRPIDQIGLDLVNDFAGIMAAGIKSIKVFPPKGTFSGMSAAQIVAEAQAR